jgi:DNA sulfur modification protein DndD
MLIRSIKLENFRQFRNESLNFARCDDGRNVTIIIGQNGSGKSTFLQSFLWCLYGETDFKDKTVLSKQVFKEMHLGEDRTVSVTLCLRHGTAEYTFVRKQNCFKDMTGRLKEDNAEFSIAKKDESGITSYAKPYELEPWVNAILPKDLSHYFFFDGERIEKLVKDIASGKEARDFADAVKGLLGLNPVLSALSHLNPKSKCSVIGEYNRSFDSNANSKIKILTDTIEDCNQKLAGKKAALEQFDEQKEAAEAMKADKEKELKQYADGKKLQDERDDLFRRIKNAESDRVSQCKNICGNFSKSMSPFFSLSLIDRALSLLSRHYLAQFMQRKTGDISLLEFVTPKSISNVSEFNAESRYRVAKYVDLVQESHEKLVRIRNESTEISELKNQLRAVEKKLSGKDVSAKVNEIETEIQSCNSTIRRCSLEHDRLINEQGRLEAEYERAYKERDTVILQDKETTHTLAYLTYAQRIYDELLSFYKEREWETRNRLQDTINSIFKQIYEGGLHLTIDEKYHITVQADDYGCVVETSTAQSISAIFAFILSIIRMAKENRASDDPNARMLFSETYPLVMSDPFASFDKLRIRRVCETIPSIADQIIIFTKDNDGELIEDYMGAKIGSRHWLYKQNEFETVLA